MTLLTSILEEIAHYVDLFGIFLILYGFTFCAISLVTAEVRTFGSDTRMEDFQRIRLKLGTYILTGIEFMIASDIIHTVLTRELMDLAFVSALVVIRTAISFFLGREIKAL